MRLRIEEGTKYDKQAAKILVDSGLFSEDIANNVIQALFRGPNGNDPDIHAFVRAPAWLEKYLKGIARMIVEESKGDRQTAIDFLTNCASVFDQYLTWVRENRDKVGTALDDQFVNKMSYQDVKDELQKIQDELNKQSQDELSKMEFGSSNFELIPIESYKEMHSKFGGSKTGDGSSDGYAGDGSNGTAWCHTNNERVYNSWVNDDRFKFFVLANKNWEDIPFDSASNDQNPKDDYGNSLIAILVNTTTGELDRVTLRCNHVGVHGFVADNAYKTYAELSKIAGFNVQEEVLKALNIQTLDISGMSTKEIWLKYFDGTRRSVEQICLALGIEPKDISEAYIPDGITEIKAEAFWGCGIKEIVIPDSVIKIWTKAFMDCTSLEKVTLSSNLEIIGVHVFAYCENLKKIDFPDTLKVIGAGSFSGSGLTQVSLPESLEGLGATAFYGCHALNKVKLSNSIVDEDYLGNSIFMDCISLESIDFGHFATIGQSMFSRCLSLKSIKLPETITKIQRDAFKECPALSNVELPNSLERIDTGAFAFCDALDKIEIPSSVTEFGLAVFHGSNSANSNKGTDVTVNLGTGDYDNLRTYIRHVNLPTGITQISPEQFRGWTMLEEVTIPNGVTEIGTRVFMDCHNLKKVRIPNSVTKIGYAAFYNCFGLTSIKIPSSVTDLDGGSIFHNCGNYEEGFTIYAQSQTVIDYCETHGIRYSTNLHESFKLRLKI